MTDPILPHYTQKQVYQLPAQPGDVISKWMSDNVTEEIAGVKYLRTTGDHTGDIVLGELESRMYGWIDPNWVKIGAVGDRLKITLDNEAVEVHIDGYYNGGTNPDPDDIGLVVTTDGTIASQTFRLTGSTVSGRNALDVHVANTTAIPISGSVSISNLAGLATAANQSIQITELNNILTEVTGLNSLDRNIGAVGATTLRVHLSDESLAALENINIIIDNVDLDIRDLTHVSDSIRLGDGIRLTGVTANNELKVHDTDLLTQLTTLNAKDFATQTTLSTLLTAFNNEDFATQTTLAALNAKVTTVDTDNVTVVSNVLPTNAATETTLSSIDDKLKAFDLDTGASFDWVTGVNLRLSSNGGSVEAGTAANPIRVDPTGTTNQPISATSLPLPTGAATEATLASIGLIDFATETTLATLNSKFNTLGQKTSAVSHPVVLPSDQVVPISVTSLPLPAGAATEATLSNIETDIGLIESNISTIANWDTNVGSTGANTQRVHLSNESLAALENIEVTVENVDLDIRDLTHVSDSIRLGDGTTLTDVTLNNELKVRDNDAINALIAIRDSVQLIDNAVDGTELRVDVITSALPTGAATEVTLNSFLTAFNAEDFASETTLAAVLADTAIISGWDTNVGAVGANTQRVHLSDESLAALENITVTIDNIDVDIRDITHTQDSIRLGDGTTLTDVTLNNELKVHDTDALVQLTSLAGEDFATETTLALVQGLLTTIDADTSALAGTVSGSELQVDVVTSALPAGAATEATISSVDSKLANNYGVATAGLRTTSQIGSATGPADFGAGLTSAQTLRVVLPTDQSPIPSAQSGTWNINNISGTVSLPTGAATETTLAAILADTAIMSTWDTNAGAVGANTQRVHLSDESLAALENITVTIDDVDLDIRDLSHTQDSVRLGDGTTLTGVTANNELQVHDADVLTQVTSIAGEDFATETTLAAMNAKLPTLGQKVMAASQPVVIASDQSQIEVKNILHSGGVYNNTTVGTTAVEAKAGVSRLSTRKLLTVQPQSGPIYWGFDNSVTTSNGTEITKKNVGRWAIGDDPIWLVSGSASNDVRITESP